VTDNFHVRSLEKFPAQVKIRRQRENHAKEGNFHA
jgi:hypothetical protein